MSQGLDIVEEAAGAFVGQIPFLEDWSHRFVSLEGGLGAGKTRAGAWKAMSLHTTNAFDDAGEPTYCQGSIICDTYQNLERYDVPAFLEEADRVGVSAVHRKDPPRIIIEDFGTKARPSIIHLCTAEQPQRISGFNASWLWGDEAARWKEDQSGNPKNDPLIQAMGRLRDEKATVQQAIFTYTNEGDGTPIYRFMRERDPDTQEPRPDRAVYVASTRDNIYVSRFLQSQLAVLSPELVDQYVDGKAINIAGARAYSLFSRSEHRGPQDLKLCPGVPVVLTLDFNIAPGMHAIIGQFDEARDIAIPIYEIHEKRMDVRRCVASFAAILASVGGIEQFGEVHIYGDATGNSEWAGTSESCYTVLFQCLDQYGIPYRNRAKLSNPAQNDRVNAVQCALRDVSGNRHVLIHPRCSGLMTDLEQTKWDDKGRELDKRRPDVSHYSDAFGYWVYAKRPVRLDRSSVGGRIAMAGR